MKASRILNSYMRGKRIANFVNGVQRGCEGWPRFWSARLSRCVHRKLAVTISTNTGSKVTVLLVKTHATIRHSTLKRWADKVKEEVNRCV